MTSRDDLDHYQSAVDRVVSRAQTDLESVLRQIMVLPPEHAREELLATLPGLVDRYGDLVATAAAEWYEDLRREAVPGRFNAILAQPTSIQQIEGTVRFAVGHLFTDDPWAIQGVLSGAVQRYVTTAGRDTIARNVARDRAKPRFARVPRGSRTCAWCTMLASRGWAYHTRETAGEGGGFHDKCDCQIVPEWRAGEVHFDGYDPDRLYDLYSQARDEVARDGLLVSDQMVAQRMRDMFPDEFTDGSAIPSILTDRGQGWPDTFAPMRERDWRHILDRHAPGGRAQTTFPDRMSNYDIARLVRDILTSPDVVLPHPKIARAMNAIQLVDGQLYTVAFKDFDGTLAVTTAFPVGERTPIMEAWKRWHSSS